MTVQLAETARRRTNLDLMGYWTRSSGLSTPTIYEQLFLQRNGRQHCCLTVRKEVPCKA